MNTIIQELLLEGVIQVWISPGSGSVHDYSENGRDGTLSAGCIWTRDKLRFPANTDEVTIADVAALRLTTGTVIAAVDVQRMTATEYVVAHDNAGAGFSFGLNATQLLFTGDGVARNIAANLIGVSCLGATFVSGGTPIGYVDGLSIGNFSGVATVTATAVVTEIGNWANSGRCLSPVGDVMVLSRVLTATEMSRLSAALINLRWPTKFVSSAKRTQTVDKADSKLISGWDLKPAGGTVPDEITTRDLTTISNMVSKPGILGEGMSGPEAGYLLSGVQPYSSADFGNGYSVECWCKLSSIPAANRYIQDFVGRIRLLSNAGQVSFSVYDSSPGFQTASSAVGAVRADDIFHIVGTAKANGDVRLYINEVLQPTVDTMLLFNCNGTGRPMTWGNAWNFITGMNGDLYKPRIYDYELSQAEVSAKYLEGAQAIQFKTDFGQQISPAAEGGVVGQIIGTRSSPLRAGDATFRGIIETALVNGRLNKVLRCTVAGDVYVSRERWFDCTPTEAGFGSFGGWMKKADASTLTWKFIGTDLNAAANGYAVVWGADESVVISELGVGNVIAGGTASHSTWHKFDQTRAGDGDFVAYVDDVTFGNGNDLTITTSIGMLWSMGVGDSIALSNVSGDDCQFKRLGVVAP